MFVRNNDQLYYILDFRIGNSTILCETKSFIIIKLYEQTEKNNDIVGSYIVIKIYHRKKFFFFLYKNLPKIKYSKHDLAAREPKA